MTIEQRRYPLSDWFHPDNDEGGVTVPDSPNLPSESRLPSRRRRGGPPDADLGKTRASAPGSAEGRGVPFHRGPLPPRGVKAKGTAELPRPQPPPHRHGRPGRRYGQARTIGADRRSQLIPQRAQGRLIRTASNSPWGSKCRRGRPLTVRC
jgi:hypothetical protein